MVKIDVSLRVARWFIYIYFYQSDIYYYLFFSSKLDPRHVQNWTLQKIDSKARQKLDPRHAQFGPKARSKSAQNWILKKSYKIFKNN